MKTFSGLDATPSLGFLFCNFLVLGHVSPSPAPWKVPLCVSVLPEKGSEVPQGMALRFLNRSFL